MLPDFTRELSSDQCLSSLNPTLQHHPQFAWLTDTLSRSEQHHALIYSQHSEKWHTAFAEGFALHLVSSPVSLLLQQARCIYLDSRAARQKNVLSALTPTDEKNLIAIISLTGPFDPGYNLLAHTLRLHLENPHWRLILIAPADTARAFTLSRAFYADTTLGAFTSAETLALLKYERSRLEQYHKVILPDDTVTTACALARRWLGGESLADKTLQLLDSAAARAAAQPQTSKPVVTAALLNNVTADWSRVPVTHLQGNRLLANALSESLRKDIFGQEEALRQAVRLLQTACLRFEEKSGPFCHFLLTGPEHSGKSTFAASLAQIISGRADRLVRVKPAEGLNASINTLIQHPYAVILIHGIETLPPDMMAHLEEILMTGKLTRPGGETVDFTHAILILTATTQTAIPLMQTPAPRPETENRSSDLMQLVLGNPEEFRSKPERLENEPFTQQNVPIPLPESIPVTLRHYLHPIPFTALTFPVVEKILKKQIAALAHPLEKRSGVSLEILPEVIQFLTQASMLSVGNLPADHALEQYLLPCIAQALYGSSDRHPRPERLRVRLNGNGDVLLCDPVSIHETVHN